jgi:hypothetical protein
MPWNIVISPPCNGPKDPTRRGGAWAGATPVWAPLARPDLLAGSRRSEVAPAHAFIVLNRVNPRREEQINVVLYTEAS